MYSNLIKYQLNAYVLDCSFIYLKVFILKLGSFMTLKLKFLVLVVSFVSVVSAIELNIQDIIKSKMASQTGNVDEGMGVSYESSRYTPLRKSLDIQIDENEYMLGSGDVISIYLWGTVNEVLKAVVNIEGKVLIPGIGEVDVKGKSLFDGKKLIIDKIQQVLNVKDFSISLTEVREFKVYLLGKITEPGDYIANGGSRVSDIISISLANSNGSKIKQDYLRNIIIKNDELYDRKADLSLFYHSNIIDKNPYLFEGDRIFIEKRTNTISISGAVNYSGTYGYVEGDSLGLVILVAGGLSRDADSTKITVCRFFNNVDSLVYYNVDITDSISLGFEIEKDDRILVKSIPDYRIHRQVFIKGEVKYPGIYPIQKDKTKLYEILEMAGGLTDQAFLKGSKMIRRKHTNVGDKEFERILKLPPESLSPLEKSYLKTRLTEEDKRVNIDFDELLNENDDINNIVLRDGDEITIAHKNLSVKMTGAVINPGLIEFKKDENINYYIKRAGGFNSRAKKRTIFIMKAGTEVWLEPKETEELEPGDAIWVPDKGYRNGYSIAKEIIVVVGSVAALIISAFTIHDFLTND